MARAGDTAIGRNRVTIKNAQTSKPRGSWEGYMQAPSTNIQMNHTGYLAKAAQKARNNVRQPMNFSSPARHVTDPKYQVRSKPFDYTYSGSPGNSIHLMNQRMELNDLFKG